MKIAVLLGGINYDTQKRTINGILDSALPDKAEVYIFTSEGWSYGSRFKYERGEYNIYNLPDFSYYDGVIINADTIHDLEIIKSLEERIKESGVPCVSLNLKWDGVTCIRLENKSGMSAIAGHLIEAHGVRSIYYIAGPKDNYDSRDRLQIFRDIMEEHQLDCKEEDIYYGELTYLSGTRAVEHLLSLDRPLPDAIMTSNDRMAIGAVQALQKAGYRVPEDIIVTGYDDCDLAGVIRPRITTVRRGGYAAGETAYKKLKQMWEEKEQAEDGVIYGTPIFSESCGCEKRNSYTHGDLQELYVENITAQDYNRRFIRESAVDFTGVEDLDDLVSSVEKYARAANPDYFYLCANGSREDYNKRMKLIASGQGDIPDTSTYVDNIWMLFAYERGEVKQYEDFDRKYLLPPDRERGTGGDFYYVVPLHHQDHCYGYCVLGNYRPVLERDLIQRFVLNLSNAMESVFKQGVMKVMLNRLSRKWRYDELTGVYNRAGFHDLADKMIKKAKAGGKSVAVLFADADGLKRVNDYYGHDEGDAYIRAIAGVFARNCREGDLLSRYGGDEFIILTLGRSEEELEGYRIELQKAVVDYNYTNTNKWYLEVSIGFCVNEDPAAMDLDKIIEIADQDMYKIKRYKKLQYIEVEE